MRITRKLIIAAYIFGFVISIPIFICIAIRPSIILLDEEGCLASISTISNKTTNVTIYEFKVPAEKYPIIYRFFAIFYGILIKSLPGIVLTVISYKLIIALIEARKRRAVMVVSSNLNLMEKQTDRTTIILVLILALFIAAEIPHGICATITGIVGPEFYWDYYYYTRKLSKHYSNEITRRVVRLTMDITSAQWAKEVLLR
ncbi:uncharacterized protein LOC135834187 [Planococcus citri]|uniref:uncharacterized protein LOC135834187 n=1 Tax=Planococcus citri TaxID=170843 RepID=UPI0031F743C3